MVRVLIKRIPKKNSRTIQQQTNLHWISIVTESFSPSYDMPLMSTKDLIKTRDVEETKTNMPKKQNSVHSKK